MNLRELLTEDVLLLGMKAQDSRSSIRELVHFMREKRGFTEEAANKIEGAVWRREKKGTTGIGKGVAIPHVKDCPHVSGITAVLGISPDGIEFASLDGEPVHLVFLVVSPLGSESEHLQVMRKLSYLARDGKTIRFLAAGRRLSSFPEILQEIDEQFEEK